MKFQWKLPIQISQTLLIVQKSFIEQIFFTQVHFSSTFIFEELPKKANRKKSKNLFMLPFCQLNFWHNWRCIVKQLWRFWELNQKASQNWIIMFEVSLPKAFLKNFIFNVKPFILRLLHSFMVSKKYEYMMPKSWLTISWKLTGKEL